MWPRPRSQRRILHADQGYHLIDLSHVKLAYVLSMINKIDGIFGWWNGGMVERVNKEDGMLNVNSVNH